MLKKKAVEWARNELEKGYNPNSALETISAFATDMENWGTGYIEIGAVKRNGRLLKPTTWLFEDSIDHIQKELLKYCNYLKPKYISQSEPIQYEGKYLLLVWCLVG